MNITRIISCESVEKADLQINPKRDLEAKNTMEYKSTKNTMLWMYLLLKLDSDRAN